MDQSLKWLPDADGTAWKPLADEAKSGLRVPAGYIVFQDTAETEIRSAYERIKIQEKTHFVAVRGKTHAVLNVIGPDRLMHTIRRLRSESPGFPLLVQRMIHSTWCGKVRWTGKQVQIRANEGMQLLDPDTYVVDSVTGACLQRQIEPKQRRMIQHVDGSAKVIEWAGERSPMTEGHLAKIVELAARAGGDIGWAVDDLDKLWLISRD
jgi:hypothetical protein